MQANRFAKWTGSYRSSLENAGLAGLKGLTPNKLQAFRGFEPGQPSNPSAAERGLTGLKSASAIAQPRPSYNLGVPPAEIPVPNPKPMKGGSNPSNPNPGAMGLTPSGSETEEICGFEVVQTRQTRQTPNLNDAEHEIVSRAASGPVGDDAAAWRAWMRNSMPVWQACGLSRAKALCSVWAEAENIWHCRHGARHDPNRCAGCGEWMLDGPGMRFRFDCLIPYGQEWRAAASAGLMVLGLKRPEP